ncbi:MAG TPA: O-antigen ligase family protein, partial [Firmicutes bacterium]|nr:O-antigen ligase family protein [Bacillota bacterium]
TLFVGFNGFGTLIVLGTGVGLGYLAGLSTKWRWATVAGYLALSVVAVLITYSRGAWLGYLGMLAVFALANRHVRRWTWFAIAGLAAGWFMVPGLHTRLVSAFSLAANSNRLFIWRSTLDIIKDHPLFGVGAGVFMHIYEKYALPGAPEKVVAYAHNLFLQVLAEFGIIGFVLFVAVVGRVLLMSWRLARTGEPLYQGIFASFIGVLIHQQVDIPIWGLEVGGAFWLLVGLVISLYVHEMGQNEHEQMRGHWWSRVHRVQPDAPAGAGGD